MNFSQIAVCKRNSQCTVKSFFFQSNQGLISIHIMFISPKRYLNTRLYQTFLQKKRMIELHGPKTPCNCQPLILIFRETKLKEGRQTLRFSTTHNFKCFIKNHKKRIIAPIS